MMPRAGFPPEALPGWAEDDHAAALAAYRETADILPAHWPRPGAADARDPRGFFEREFVASVAGEPPALITGYYEPEVAGRDAPEPGFPQPLYAMPEGLDPGREWHTRSQIEAADLLRGLELVWLSGPVEAFFAQVQGSVRVRLPGGRVRRFGHSGKNGHPYRSIGAELIRRGEIAEAAMSAQAIRAWCAAHPDAVAELLRHNPSFVFFRELDLPGSAGPLGAAGQPVTAWRSLAVDPAHHPLGAPVWLEMPGERRLMVAQDTGSAIKGAQRGDVFCGWGDAAGDAAGRMRETGRLVTFFPRDGGAP